MHNTQQCGSFLESCVRVYKPIRTVGMIVNENKGVWLGRDFTFDFIPQTLMSCGSCPPALLSPGARRKDLLTGMGWSMRRGSGSKTHDVLQQSQPTMISTTTWSAQAGESRVKDRQCACHNDRCSLLLCLAVCSSGWEQLWHMQRAVGRDSMYTNTGMRDQRRNREAMLMYTRQMHLNPWWAANITGWLQLFKIKLHHF